ncbi:MAG: hypothetical protein ACYC99_15380 [Candidatus Geothermincolia bacterium]
MKRRSAALAMLLCLMFVAGSFAVLAGCSQGKPQVIVFIGKSSKSYADVNAMVAEAKKKFGDKVTFTTYNYDAASSAGAKKKYFVSMNPTIIITNAQGQIKQTYMGKPMKDELLMTIEGFIPSSGGKTSTPSSTPGSTNIPGTPYPAGSTPGGTPPVPLQTAPVPIQTTP